MEPSLRTKVHLSSLILGAALFAQTAAMAAGLGQMTVLSTLGQPLTADIDLVVGDTRELDGLVARIASVHAHRQANVPYTVATFGLRAAIQTGKDGRQFIRVESVRPITEPAVKLLIELAGAQTQSLREFTVLLEPPEMQRR